MLEKMGWAKGKGLGANEDGIKDFVRVRMRNNNEGLGYEDRDDHWTQHEQSFSGLLKTLNGESEENHKDGEKSENEEEDMPRVGFGFKESKPKAVIEKLTSKFSGESLEEKSKRSKARVHYKKFTKGKDLSQYSEKDLANIFGKKVIENQQPNGIYEQLTEIVAKESSDEEQSEVKSNFGGVQTVSTGLSVEDYFKQKMEAMKNRKVNEAIKSELTKESETDTQTANVKEKKKKQKLSIEESVAFEEKVTKKKRKKDVEETIFENVADEKEIYATVDLDRTLKKKKKKRKDIPEIVDNKDDKESQQINKKKKSKRKVEALELEIETTDCTNDVYMKEETNEESQPQINKKKKSKRKTEIPKSENENFSDVVSKKIKKNKKDETLVHAEPKDSEASLAVADATKPKKNKSNKKTVSATQEVLNHSIDVDDLKNQYNSYNVFTISSFCAEKFRNIDLTQFKDSNMPQINGYSFDGSLKLKVKQLKSDEDRITQLWNCSVNKYRFSNPKNVYRKYCKQVHNARTAKTKPPRFNVKTWKRKNVFQIL